MCKKELLSNEKQKIVILDDDDAVIDVLKQLLKPFNEKADIFYFSYPTDEFIKLIRDSYVDLFILDIVLAGVEKSGIDISEDIINCHRGSLFLFISGYDYNIKSFDHLTGKCVYDFMSKPINTDELLVTISTLLNIATTYKQSFIETRIKPRELDNLRQRYMRLLDKDKRLIKTLKDSMINNPPLKNEA